MQLRKSRKVLKMCGNRESIHVFILHKILFQISYRLELENILKMQNGKKRNMSFFIVFHHLMELKYCMNNLNLKMLKKAIFCQF